MKKIPVKSLLKFRMVSKSWKYTIDSDIFDREYGSRQCEMCCFTLKYNVGNEHFMCSAYGQMSLRAILWNPCIRNFSGIEVPFMPNRPAIEKIVWGFGVRPDTLDPTILNISMPLYGDGPWHVLMYTLNSDTWTVLGNYCLPQVEAAVVTSWRVLFVIPSQNIAKLLGFTMDDDPIVEVDSGQEMVHMLQVYDRPSHQFHNVGIEGLLVIMNYTAAEAALASHQRWFLRLECVMGAGTTQVQNDGKHSTDEKLIPVEKPNVSEIKDPALRQDCVSDVLYNIEISLVGPLMATLQDTNEDSDGTVKRNHGVPSDTDAEMVYDCDNVEKYVETVEFHRRFCIDKAKKGYSRTCDWDNEKLLEHLPSFQQLLYRLMGWSLSISVHFLVKMNVKRLQKMMGVVRTGKEGGDSHDVIWS
ncbi:F-box domain containing protein [Tanacetum coccineum]|uniref:F-box domain containing protein n=1 Tax=Tanacetum coccineum TaxID=301880 RepID=A0ABQ4YY38_9ASTR